MLGVSGITKVKVKSRDLSKNTKGAGSFLKVSDTKVLKHRDQTGLDTLVVYALKVECSMLFFI